MKHFTPYYKAVHCLESLATLPLNADYLKRNAKDPNIYLERTACLLKLLGDPHRGFRYLHVSGTAGKGSTVAFLHQMLYLSGFRVGSFYSPFATTSIEKIKVNDKLINPLDFAKLTERIKIAAKKMVNSKFGRPSYFECFFALALLYFKKTRCQWVVLEVGLGGKFDATNIISRSEVSAITNVGLDHTDILGKTLSAIARDKAGIIKPNSHFFTTETRPTLLKIFKEECLKKHTKLHTLSLRAKPDEAERSLAKRSQPEAGHPLGGNPRINLGIATSSRQGRTPRNDTEMNLAGPYQLRNVALASAIGRHLKINDKIISQAIAETSLPCRFEIIQTNPLVILDGAHNPLKIKSVMHNLKSLTYKKLCIIFASARNKDARAMTAQLQRAADEIIFTQIKTAERKFRSAAELGKLIPSFKKKIIEPNPRQALKKALKKLKPQDALLITGSFYLAGELRKHWISEETILRKRKA